MLTAESDNLITLKYPVLTDNSDCANCSIENASRKNVTNLC